MYYISSWQFEQYRFGYASTIAVSLVTRSLWWLLSIQMKLLRFKVGDIMKKYGILLVKSLVGCVFLAFTLFPIVLLISSSLKIDTEVFDYRIIPKHITLDAYKQVFRILDIFTGIRNSLFVATMVTVLA